MPLILSSRIVVEKFAKELLAGVQSKIRNKPVTPYGSMGTTDQAAQSLFYSIEDNNLIFGSHWAYIMVLEDGRKPGKFAPPEVIEKWVGDKPVTGDIPRKSLAFLINRKLKEKGSLLWQQGGNSGIISDLVNSQYIHTNLTLPLKDSVIDEVTSILFRNPK